MDGQRRCALCMERIGSDDCTCDIKRIQEVLQFRDFIGCDIHVDLAEHLTGAMYQCRKEMDRALTGSMPGPACILPIDGNCVPGLHRFGREPLAQHGI